MLALWKGFPPDMLWYEPAENIGSDFLDEYEAGLEAEAQLDAEEAAALEGEDEGEMDISGE